MQKVDFTELGINVKAVIRNPAVSLMYEEAIRSEPGTWISSRRIALNPDCGFAPDAGEPPSIDEAYEKLRRLVAAASRLRARFIGGAGLAADQEG